MGRNAGVRAGIAIFGAAAALACGGGVEEAPKPTGPSMVTQEPAIDREENVPPTISRVTLSPEQPVSGTAVQAVVEAMDPDGDPLRLSFEWKKNGQTLMVSAKPGFMYPDLQKGDRIEVVVTATDGRAESAPARASSQVGNRPPLLSAVYLKPKGTVRPGDTLVVDPEATDPDNDTLRYQYSWFVNGSERGQGREFATQDLRRGDRLYVEVVAGDGTGRSHPLKSRDVTIGNSLPVIAQLPHLETDSGTFRYAFEATDADGDRNLRFFLEKSPGGMEIDPITGVVVWKPKASQGGVHEVEVGVKDSAGEGTIFAFEVTVSVTQTETAPAAPTPTD